MNTKHLFKASFGALTLAAALAFSVSSAQAAAILTDTFENRTLGSTLNASTPSGPGSQTWKWFGGGTADIGAYGGNKYADFSGVTISGLTPSSNGFSTGIMPFASATQYTLSYDFLWLSNFSGTIGQGLNTFFNTNSAFNNPSTNNVAGYFLRVSATNANEASWMLTQRSTAEQIIAQGTFVLTGFINATAGTGPGNPLNVALTWQGNAISLDLNGTSVYDSEVTPFTPLAQNLTLANTTYTTFYTSNHRSEAMDNVLIVPEPSTWVLLAFSLTTVLVLHRRRMA